jgi:hypothetical protein
LQELGNRHSIDSVCQHNGLRSCPAAGCKREQAERHFAEYDELGYTILALSSLSQPSTASSAERSS